MFKSDDEWLETDGFGGYASGRVDGIRSRKYHGLLCSALTPPTKRSMLVVDILTTLIWQEKEIALETIAWANTNVTKSEYIECCNFSNTPWPTWNWSITGFGNITKEICMPHGKKAVYIRYSISTTHKNWHIESRPLLAGRSHHALIQNIDIPWSEQKAENIEWKKEEYTIVMHTKENYESDAVWYKNFLYSDEKTRGYEYIESLYSPGKITIHNNVAYIECSSLKKENIYSIEQHMFMEKIRRESMNLIERMSEKYIVHRVINNGDESKNIKTVIAGYPWFTDWGRDTFISMRGLFFVQEKYSEALEILLYFASQEKEGLLPNRFIDEDSLPEYNSVDAPLWFIIMCYELLEKYSAIGQDKKNILIETCKKIIDSFIKGTKYNIHMDNDALLYAGEDGIQLTWMDAKFGDHVITPRIGKPIEIQALWINALKIVHILTNNTEYNRLYILGIQTFTEKFWNTKENIAYDVITDHLSNSDCRPNQLFAIGGLPFALFNKEIAKKIVETVYKNLYTPLGIRTLNPDNTSYQCTYNGSQYKRDTAYHQGTAWPWLLGVFTDAWLYAYGNTNEQKQYILRTFIEPLTNQLHEFGIDGICEVSDGNLPQLPNGCPWQAWSIAEYIRILNNCKIM